MEPSENKESLNKAVDPKQMTWQQNLWFQLKSLIPAVLLVLAVRSSFVEPFKIPSGSMIPTLLVGDYVFVNKFAYGFKAPFFEWFLDEPVVLFGKDVPKRGDVVVFKYPRDESIYYIKRVVGLPGEHVRVDDKKIYINNKLLDQADQPLPSEVKALDSMEYDTQALRYFQEDTLNTPVRKHAVLIDDRIQMFKSFEEVTVPEGHLFVMGDNRDHSNDSRFWGFVPLRNVKGRAFMIWFSMWLGFEKSEYSFKPNRIGTML